MISNDHLEGTLYRTQVHESKISISFQSRVLFDMFQRKVHADFQQSVEKDETTFVSKCSTHIKGVKCDLRLDSHFKTVELSGMGFKLWRYERFPTIAKSLFKRLMEEVDSQLEGSSTGQPLPEDLSDSCFQLDSSCTGTENNICTDDALLENGCWFSAQMVMTQSPKEGNTIQPAEPAPLSTFQTSEQTHATQSLLLAPTSVTSKPVLIDKCLMPTAQFQKDFTAEKNGLRNSHHADVY